jgi:hypothetical protein
MPTNGDYVALAVVGQVLGQRRAAAQEVCSDEKMSRPTKNCVQTI